MPVSLLVPLLAVVTLGLMLSLISRPTSCITPPERCPGGLDSCRSKAVPRLDPTKEIRLANPQIRGSPVERGGQRQRQRRWRRRGRRCGRQVRIHHRVCQR
jgi:hypothetical protein